MTYVSQNFSNSLNSNRKLKFYWVEVITFDGESYTEEIEARSAEEAQELKIAEHLGNKLNVKQIAASMYDEVDYTMVQSCVAGW